MSFDELLRILWVTRDGREHVYELHHRGSCHKWVEDFFFDADNVEVEGGQFLKI